MTRFSFETARAKATIAKIKNLLAANPAATAVDVSIAIAVDLHTTNRYLRFLRGSIIRSQSTAGSARALFDFAMAKVKIKNFSKFAKFIGVDPATVSRMISGREKISPSTILALHERTGMAVADIRKMLLPDYLAGANVDHPCLVLAEKQNRSAATKIDKRAAGRIKVRNAIRQFVLASNGVSTVDIAKKIHISTGSARLHALAVAEAGLIVRCCPPQIGRKFIPTMWFSPDAELPVYAPIPTPKSKVKSSDYPQTIMTEAKQVGMVRVDPLMLGLFGAAKAST